MLVYSIENVMFTCCLCVYENNIISKTGEEVYQNKEFSLLGVRKAVI